MTKRPEKTLLEQLAAAGAAEKALAQQLAVAKAHTSELIGQCLDSGLALPAVAAAAGLTPSGTRSRLKADPSNPLAWPAVRARAQAAEEKRGRPRTRVELPPAPKGYARMTDAAKILDLSRSGVYYKIASGELAVREIDGHRYVKLPKT